MRAYRPEAGYSGTDMGNAQVGRLSRAEESDSGIKTGDVQVERVTQVGSGDGD